MAFLGLGALFFDCLLKLVQILAQLHECLLCKFGSLSAFLGSPEIGFHQPVFLIFTTVSCVVRSMHAPMLLAEVIILLSEVEGIPQFSKDYP